MGSLFLFCCFFTGFADRIVPLKNLSLYKVESELTDRAALVSLQLVEHNHRVLCRAQGRAPELSVIIVLAVLRVQAESAEASSQSTTSQGGSSFVQIGIGLTRCSYRSSPRGVWFVSGKQSPALRKEPTHELRRLFGVFN